MMEFSEDKIKPKEFCFPFHNSSCTKDSRSTSEYIMMYVFFASVSVITIFLNLLVIISISHFKQLHTPTNLLILSLAVADLLIGMIVMPLESIRLIESCWYFGQEVCSLLPVILCILISGSLGNLVFIAIDRYVAICDPFLYASKMTLEKSVVCIAMCWSCSLVYNLILLLLNGNIYNPDMCLGQCELNIDINWGIIDLVISFILPCSVLITLYMIIFRVARRQSRLVNANARTYCRSDKVNMSMKPDRKAAKTLGIVIFVYLLCWIPYYMSILMEDTTSFVVLFFSWVLYMNSFVNPLIYAMFYPWFKISVRHIVTLRILDPSSPHLKLSAHK